VKGWLIFLAVVTAPVWLAVLVFLLWGGCVVFVYVLEFLAKQVGAI
jgi:hypothetical protein